jgi:hypothetical protein
MARPPLVLIRGGASRVATEQPRKPDKLQDDAPPYAELVEIARRRAFYAALTDKVFDASVERAGDPRFRKRRR